jgi:hypothetical protein
MRSSASKNMEEKSTPNIFSAKGGSAHNKVTICHVTGNSSSHEIVVNHSAAQAHLNHGDSLGECDEVEAEPEVVEEIEEEMVTICHLTPTQGAAEYQIPSSSLQEHLEHGDSIGVCPVVEIPVENPMIVTKSNFCSKHRTLGPYSPEIDAWFYEYIPGISTFQTFTTSDRISFGFTMTDRSFFIPNQNAELNYINVAHSSRFDMSDMMNEPFPEGLEVVSIFYSFHSDEDIENYGHKVFANSFTNNTDWTSKDYQQASFHKEIISILYSRLEYGDDYNCNEVYSPLMIDLNKKGIELTAPKFGMLFDINGNGSKEKISCPVSSGTPFLVLPLDGEVVNINQLFGNHTIGPDGEKSDNGFVALAKYDENLDGVINVDDEIYNDLRLWDEINCNGVVDEGELSKLELSGIIEINLLYKNIFQADKYGNASKQHSYVKSDRGNLSIFDVWFVGL